METMTAGGLEGVVLTALLQIRSHHHPSHRYGNKHFTFHRCDYTHHLRLRVISLFCFVEMRWNHRERISFRWHVWASCQLKLISSHLFCTCLCNMRIGFISPPWQHSDRPKKRSTSEPEYLYSSPGWMTHATTLLSSEKAKRREIIGHSHLQIGLQKDCIKKQFPWKRKRKEKKSLLIFSRLNRFHMLLCC